MKKLAKRQVCYEAKSWKRWEERIKVICKLSSHRRKDNVLREWRMEGDGGGGCSVGKDIVVLQRILERQREVIGSVKLG